MSAAPGTSPAAGPADSAEQWQAFWRQRERRPLGRVLAWGRRKLLTPALARFVMSLTRRGTLVEAGCGSGGVSIEIAARRGDALVLVDLAPEALALARAGAAARGLAPRTAACDIAELSAHVARGDDAVVYNVGVVEHFPDAAPVLREMAAVSGRYALAVVPAKSAFWQTFVWLARRARLAPPGFFIRFYDAAGLRRDVRRAGLQVLRVDCMRLFGTIPYLGICFRCSDGPKEARG